MNYSNHLLRALLKTSSNCSIVDCLEVISLTQGEILHRPGEPIEYVYFPLSCLLSITITMQNGATAETGLAGNRGMVGINAVMEGSATTQTTYIVQIPGQSVRLAASILRQKFNEDKALQNILLRYTQAFIAQVSQTTACNRLHTLEQRFARWLLESHDRVGSDSLPLTQELVACMLGVRRAGVSQAAQKFQENGSIRYTRGRVQIQDLGLLKTHACECFDCIKSEYNRLLGNREETFLERLNK